MSPIFAFSTLLGPADDDFWLRTNPSTNSVSSTVPLLQTWQINDKPLSATFQNIEVQFKIDKHRPLAWQLCEKKLIQGLIKIINCVYTCDEI